MATRGQMSLCIVRPALSFLTPAGALRESLALRFARSCVKSRPGTVLPVAHLRAFLVTK